MREVVGAELGLKAILCASFWSSHDASVGNEDIESLSLGEEFLGAVSHTFQ